MVMACKFQHNVDLCQRDIDAQQAANAAAYKPDYLATTTDEMGKYISEGINELKGSSRATKGDLSRIAYLALQKIQDPDKRAEIIDHHAQKMAELHASRYAKLKALTSDIYLHGEQVDLDKILNSFQGNTLNQLKQGTKSAATYSKNVNKEQRHIFLEGLAQEIESLFTYLTAQNKTPAVREKAHQSLDTLRRDLAKHQQERWPKLGKNLRENNPIARFLAASGKPSGDDDQQDIQGSSGS
jgi:hypothetical protein